mmetsp:Transcript_114485/g.356549  ORF Transcript_114485/g.356549 Transcript_114485/m.356549 type:complete len:223 (-) Transcript_114485:606-1274(-)
MLTPMQELFARTHILEFLRHACTGAPGKGLRARAYVAPGCMLSRAACTPTSQWPPALQGLSNLCRPSTAAQGSEDLLTEAALVPAGTLFLEAGALAGVAGEGDRPGHFSAVGMPLLERDLLEVSIHGGGADPFQLLLVQGGLGQPLSLIRHKEAQTGQAGLLGQVLAAWTRSQEESMSKPRLGAGFEHGIPPDEIQEASQFQATVIGGSLHQRLVQLLGGED